MASARPLERRRLAVLGSPISHSRSPALHRAAYRTLGLDWVYEPIEIPSGGLGDFLATTDATWRGLSLTMPLKHEVVAALERVDELATLTGAANTVRFADDGRLDGFNTDVPGMMRALAEIDVTAIRHGVLLGGGATAASALAAMAELGALDVRVLVRDPARAQTLTEVGRRAGLVVRIDELAALPGVFEADLVVSTLPGDVELPVAASARLMATTPLLDVAYAPWPTALAAAWLAAGGAVQSGLAMLLHQALVQVRIFVAGDPFVPLPNEEAVLQAMREAL